MRAGSLSLLAALAGILYAPTSGAADMPANSEQPIGLLQPMWSGFYFGSHTGTLLDARGDQSVVGDDGGPLVSPTFGGRGGRTGVAVGQIRDRTLFQGLHAGYNWQQENAVLGVEADVNSFGQLDDVLGSARARLGFGVDRFLVYGTAGITFLSLSSGTGGVFVGGNGGNGGNGGPGGDGGAGGNGFGSRIIAHNSTDRTGFVGGVGAEIRLSPQVGAGIEALYHTFDGGRRDLDTPRDFVTVRGRLTFHLDDWAARSLTSTSLSSPSNLWAGLYVGGHLGALHSSSDNVIDSVALASGEPGTAGVRGIDGGGGGGGGVAFANLQRNVALSGGSYIGYSWQSQDFVFGAEADAGVSSSDSNSLFGSLRGRLGWAAHDYLFYSTAGVAIVHDDSFRAIFAENGGPGGNGVAVVAAPGGAGGRGGRALAFSLDDTRVGFVVGAGLEAKLSNHVIAGVEGLYYDFESRRDRPQLPSNGRSFISEADASDAFIVRTRLSFLLQP